MRREAEEAARKLEEERKRVQAQLEREAAELRAKVDAGLSFVGGLLDVHMWVSENIILYIYIHISIATVDRHFFTKENFLEIIRDKAKALRASTLTVTSPHPQSDHHHPSSSVKSDQQ